MKNPLVTVITATYNSGKTLEQTIVSVLEQDYPNLEYLIIDGGSSDNTIEIIKKYEIKGIKWISEHDEGLYDALNKGINMSNGDFIDIIGSDDAFASKTAISKLVENLDDNIDIICGQEMAVDEESNKTYLVCDNNLVRDKEKYQGDMIAHAAMLTRKELLLRIPFDTSYRIAADYKFFLQCYYGNANIKFIDDVIAFFATGGLSSNREECDKENNRIYKDLNLPFSSPKLNSGNLFIRIMKNISWRLHLYEITHKTYCLVKYWYNVRFKWEKHKCNNKICRWCGRI